MSRKSEKFGNYIATPFWDMRYERWKRYLDGLKGDQRRILSSYPFRWVYTPPHDAASAGEFLRDIEVGAEEVAPGKIEEILAKMPTFEDLIARGSVQWTDGEFDKVPSYGFRQIPEWEPMAGVLIHWPVFYPPLWDSYRQAVAACDHVTTFLRIPEGHLGAAVLAWLDSHGINLDKVRPIPGPIGDLWGKDFAPLYGVNTYTGEAVGHEFSFAAYGEQYRSDFKTNVDVDSKFTWAEGFKIYRTEIKIDGGYVQTTDGAGTYIMTRRILWDNESIPNLYPKLESWLGADRMIFIDEQPEDELGHINHLRFVAPGKVLVGKPDKKGTPVYKYLSKVRGLLNSLNYDVVDIPCPEQFSRTMPGGEFVNPVMYANCLLMNKRVIVPSYDYAGIEKYNEEALEAYRKALPGYQAIPIDVSIMTLVGGGLYCGSKEIPDVPAAKKD